MPLDDKIPALHVAIPPDLKREIQQAANVKGQTFSEYVRRAIKTALASDAQQEKTHARKV